LDFFGTTPPNGRTSEGTGTPKELPKDSSSLPLPGKISLLTRSLLRDCGLGVEPELVGRA
jgi:hypothetical protein